MLLNLETLFYYSLNKTGTLLWREIDGNKSTTLDELVSKVCERFEVERDTARQEVGTFVRYLEQYKMIRLS